MSPNILYLVIGSVFTLVIGFDIYKWTQNRNFIKPELRLQRFKSTTNLSVLIVATTLVLTSVPFHVNIFKYDAPIDYSGINHITLKDFKGYKLPNQTMDGVQEFAFITTSIEWHKHGNELFINSVFHPSRSYVFNENIIDKFLLQHELYHFHITEYCARQGRKNLLEFETMPSNSEIEYIISKCESLERKMQHDYDEKTYHGYILKEQNQWQKNIDSLLTLNAKFNRISIQYK
jgi:hypothetical protein